MLATWAIDISVVSRRSYPASDYGAAAAAHGLAVLRIDYNPETSLTAIAEIDGPVVCHGSIGFNLAVQNLAKSPGGFHHDRNFRPETYFPLYQDFLIAKDWTILSYQDFLARRLELEESYSAGGNLFLKPANGGKAFNGTLLPNARPLDDWHFSRYRRWAPPAKDLPVLIVRPTEIFSEWRFVIVGGVPVAVSSYVIDKAPEMKPEAPDEAWELARLAASTKWHPQPVFVLDIGRTKDGFGVIEVNQFGSSGTYAIDADIVVASVSDFIHSNP